MGELNQLSFRRAQESDAALVRELTRLAYAKWVPVIGREPVPMKADYESAVREHLIELLIRDGLIAGLVELIPEAEAMLVENLAVHPDFQAQGFGSCLLARAEEIALAHGHTSVRLYTNPLFAGNVSFYEKRGYRETHRAEVIPGSITVYMAKAL